MARKVFLSVLGTGNYSECTYTYEFDNFKSAPVRFVQEATLSLIEIQQWKASDSLHIFLTQQARKTNWEDGSFTNKYTGEKTDTEGLKKRLEKLSIPCQINPINIPDGKNEHEIWDIFEIIFDSLEYDDELYFDLTHGFRYLPMLVLVLCNYAKTLKNIKVHHISYGNFEARNSENEAPIIKLNTLSTLQDWSSASNVYLRNGNVGLLTSLCNETMGPIIQATKGQNKQAANVKKFATLLKNIVDERTTCRGKAIIYSDNIMKIKGILKELQDTSIKPFDPLFQKLRESFNSFDDKENIQNGFEAARWCLQNELYQQAITIFHENIATLICTQIEGFDWSDKKYRGAVTAALYVKQNNTPEDEWILHKVEPSEAVQLIKKALHNELLQIIEPYYTRMNDLRNDINHSGIVQNAIPADKLKRSIEEQIDTITQLIKDYVH